MRNDDVLRRIFPGDSELAVLMRNFDWLQTDLGSPLSWPENLRITVGLCLTSRFPILIWWGPRFTILYNDAYIPFLGETKHPKYLGQAGRECWAEVWDLIGPMLEGVRETGIATWSDDFLCFFRRNLPQEEVHVRFTYGPILGSDGRSVDGIFTPCTEITHEVIGARRLETLRKLGLRTAEPPSLSTACTNALNVLAENPFDISFAAIYVIEDKSAVMPGQVLSGAQFLPSSISIEEIGAGPWPFASVARTQKAVEVDLPALGISISGKAWPDPVRTAIVLPIPAAVQNQVAGLLVAGITPRRPFDAEYRAFFELVAQHVGAAITEVKAYEHERQRAEHLAQLDRAKTAFFSNISHEFRTPLTLMLAPLEDMRAEAVDDRTRTDLDLVYRNSQRLLKLVNTLLEFSRMEAGRSSALFEPTDLGTFTTELASYFRSAIESAGIRFSVDCPALDEPVYVDRGMWEKIVLNLLSNALKFTFSGQISVSLRQLDGSVELSVEDTGIGIPAEEMPRVFERFHRVEGAQGRTHEGSGIGLALVSELARMHGGSAGVESILGRGSRFVVSIALGRAHLSEDRISTHGKAASVTAQAAAYVNEARDWSDAPLVSGPANGPGVPPPGPAAPSDQDRTRDSSPPVPRILLADDNLDMRSYIRRLLAGTCEVEAVNDGLQALAAAQANPPDVVLSDIMMPRMDGMRLLRELRADPRTCGIPVILISARAGDDSRLEGLEVGADDYLVKPFSARELLVRVRNLVAVKRTREALQHALASSGADLWELANELVASHHELLQSEAHLAEAQKISRTGSCEWNIGTGEMFWSRENCRIFGVGPEEQHQSYSTFLNHVHSDDRSIVERSMNRAAADNSAFELEYRIVLSDGSTRNLHAFGRPWASDGHSAEFLTTVMDVTDRKRAEEAQRKLAAIVENSLDFIGFASLDGQADIVNPAGRHLVGLNSPEQVLLTQTTDYVVEEERKGFTEQIIPDVMRDGRWQGETHFRHFETGASIPMWQQIFLVRDQPSDRATGMATISRDITARKRAEDELRHSERYLAEAQRLSHTGSWAWNVATGDLFWSDEHFRIVGLSPGAIKPRVPEAFDVIHPDDRAGVQSAFRDALVQKTDFEVDCRVLRPDGTIRYIHSFAHPVYDPNGSLCEYVGTIIDLTERRQAEDALQTAQAELAHIARVTMMGELAASIAHEVNQPLSALVNDGEACLRWLTGAEPNITEALQSAQRIVAQAIRASEVVGRITSLIRKTPPHSSVVDLNEVIREVCTLTRYEAVRREITVRAELAPDLRRIQGDAVQLRQVVANLVINALEAVSAKTSGTRDVLVLSQNADSAAVLISVRDSGIGIEPSQIEESFQPFVTTKPNGTGMGLAISRSIVRAHGGNLWGVPNDAHGATFTFSLPAL